MEQGERTQMMLPQLTALQEIEARCEKVTPEMIVRFGSKLEPVASKEKVLGKIHSEAAKTVYCVGVLMRSEALTFATKIPSATTDEEEAELTRQCGEMKRLSDLAHELFWSEVQLQMGGAENLSVRQDFMAVSREPDGPTEILKRIISQFTEE